MRFRILAVVLLSLASSTVLAQGDPGQVLIGQSLPFLINPPVFEVCGGVLIGSPSTIDVHVQPPVDGGRRVTFGVEFDESVFVVSRTILRDGVTDASAPDDDAWELVFDSCLDFAVPPVPVIRYTVLALAPDAWVCTFGTVQAGPEWDTCAGNTVEATLFDLDLEGWRTGCFPLTSFNGFCPVSSEQATWGALKARF